MQNISDIEIDQGSDFEMQLHLEEENGESKDLTNFSIAAAIKRTYNTDSSEAISFSVGALDSSGIVTLNLTNITTDLLTSKKYVYDVNLSHVDSDSNTIVERVLEGNAYISRSVTR